MKDDDSPNELFTPWGSSVSGGGTDQSVTTPPTPHNIDGGEQPKCESASIASAIPRRGWILDETSLMVLGFGCARANVYVPLYKNMPYLMPSSFMPTSFSRFNVQSNHDYLGLLNDKTSFRSLELAAVRGLINVVPIPQY